ncbi:hypothetical protein PanWU01x14_332270 [Parasponia andersonii]|uniref:Ulp1 protease family, C-terminal catalytic domain containing protein n=1 Tax=Parasponia andersonii TaxID=3476 RepID=A0A2P5AHD8_PARAD|nr:hypothetical protein PanWU01x14_332270 [Parasponia andersonii]
MVETQTQSTSLVSNSKEISQSIGEKGEVSRSILPQIIDKRKEPPFDDPVSESTLPLIESKRKKSFSVDARPSHKNHRIWAYDCFNKLVGTVCYKVASKIPHILNYFCDGSSYFEELEKNVFEADEVVDHTPKVIGDDDMDENEEATPQVDEANKNSKVNDEEKVKVDEFANVLDVDIIANDVITLGFIPDELLDIKGIDSVNKYQNVVNNGDEERNNAEESKEEEKEDKEDDNDDKDEEKYKENDKDDKDDADKGGGKAIDKSANDGKEDETDGSDNNADKGVDNFAKVGNDDKGADNSSKDGNKENIDICDPIAEKTPVLTKGETKLGVQMSSSFINEFDSSADYAQIGSSDTLVHIESSSELVENLKEKIMLRKVKQKKPIDHVEVYMIEGLLDDCSVFVIAFAKYLIHGMLDELKKNFQVQKLLNKLSVEFYMHGRMNQIEGYGPELDFKECLSKKMKNMKT